MRLCTVQSLALALLAYSAIERASAQGIPPESQRTVAWYAAHPAQRERIRRVCLNDPGHLAHMPDCINAERADLHSAAAQAKVRAGDTSSPYSSAYWDARPNDRKYEVTLCSRETAAQRAGSTCDAAEQSMQNANK